jgi:tetratricopeptide (TPR) repeat protein
MKRSQGHGKKKAASPPPPATAAGVRTILAEGLRHHQAGRLLQAERAYRRILASDPDHSDSLHLLGVIAHQMERDDVAVGLIGRAIAVNDAAAAFHSNLGTALQDLGRPEAAIAAYTAAIGRQPDYAEAHNNLGTARLDLAQFAEAAVSFRASVVLRPNYADAYRNLGAALHKRGLFAESLVARRASVALTPGRAEAHLLVGGVLNDLGRLDEACVAFATALALQPSHAEGLNHLGNGLKERGRLDQAFVLLDRAARLATAGRDKPLTSMAVLLMEMGRAAEALAAIDQALAVNPRSANVWHIRSDLKRFSAGDPDIAKMETLHAAAPPGGPGDAERTLLAFALAKAWMDIGDADRAFVYLDEGNRLKRATFTYDADANDRWMASIVEAFPPTLLERFAGSGDPSDLPIFVVGMPRSGTTLIEQILASHPQVHGAGELTVMHVMMDRLAARLQTRFPGLLADLAPADLAALGGDYARRVSALAGGRRRVVDKMPTNFLFAGLIHLILPQARIIHCRRDPVDTCLSCYSKKFVGDLRFTYDLGELGRYYRSYTALTEHWRALLPEDRFTEVHYEDVVDDLEGQARRMLAFCGLDWDEACLAFHETSRRVATASLAQVRQPINRAGIGRWKPYEAHLAPLLAALK